MLWDMIDAKPIPPSEQEIVVYEEDLTQRIVVGVIGIILILRTAYGYRIVERHFSCSVSPLPFGAER
jgi:hypothetical protein